MFKSVPTSRLRVGDVLGSGAFDELGRKLLSAGMPVTERFLYQLQKREVRSVAIEDSDLEQLQGRSETDCSDHEAKLTECAVCGQVLPLRKAKPGEQPTNWICTQCGARYPALLDTSLCEEIFHHVRPARLDIRCREVERVHEMTAEFISKIVEKPYLGPERRGEPRYPLVVPAAALRLDEQSRAAGEPMLVMTRNISMHGLAWVYTQPIEAEFLLFQIPADGDNGLQAVVKVVRHRACGHLHEYGGKLIGRAST